MTNQNNIPSTGSGFADALNTTMPIEQWGKVRDNEMQNLLSAVQEKTKYIQAEKSAQQEIFKTLSETNKFDLLPQDQIRFKRLYEKKKNELIADMGKHESIQSFLNNGGYEKLLSFRNDLMTSEELGNGIRNQVDFATIQQAKKEGRIYGMRTSDGYELSEAMDMFDKGLINRIGYEGHYAWKGVNPSWFPAKKDETATQRIDYSPLEYANILEGENVPHQIKSKLIEQYSEQYRTGNGIPKILPDVQTQAAIGAYRAQQNAYNNMNIDWKGVIESVDPVSENVTITGSPNQFGSPGGSINTTIRRRYIPELIDRLATAKGLVKTKDDNGQIAYTLSDAVNISPIGYDSFFPPEVMAVLRNQVVYPVSYTESPIYNPRTGKLKTDGDQLLANGQPKSLMGKGLSMRIPITDQNEDVLLNYAKSTGNSMMANQIEKGFVEVWVPVDLNRNAATIGSITYGQDGNGQWKGDIASQNRLPGQVIQNAPNIQ